MTLLFVLILHIGNFGTSVGIYFHFIKWLMFMNLFSTVMILGVIVIPHEVISPHDFNSTVLALDAGEFL